MTLSNTTDDKCRDSDGDGIMINGADPNGNGVIDPDESFPAMGAIRLVTLGISSILAALIDFSASPELWTSTLFVLVRKSTPDRVLEQLTGTGGRS